MTKVLIIYCVPTQTALMESIQKNVGCQSIIIDLLDVNKWELHSLSNNSMPHKWYGKIIGTSSNNKLLSWVIRNIHKYSDKVLLRSLFSKYDIIDFHYYSSLYFPLIPVAKALDKKTKITLWGSDLLRATKEEIVGQRPGYDMVDRIQVATSFMYNSLFTVYPQVKDKTIVLPFGNQVLDDFNLRYGELKDSSFLSHYDSTKRMIVCGYNGTVGQRHLDMAKMLNELPEEIQKTLYVVFPMTYGATPSYIKKLKDCINGHGYSYDILYKRLTDKQLFDLRRLSNIVLNIQITDVFSGSIQEHVFCNNVLLVGDWLPYDIMKEAGIFFLTTSLDRLSISFLDVIYNYKTYKDKCSNNQNLIYEISSWKGLVGKWEKMYLSL